MIWFVNNWKVVGSAFLVVAVFVAGYDVASTKKELVISDLKLQYAEANKKAVELGEELRVKKEELLYTSSKLKTAEDKIGKEVVKYVDKEVIKYVQSSDSGRCYVSNDWVRIDTISARGANSLQDSKSTGGVNGTSTKRVASTGISVYNDVDLLQLTTSRNAICHAEMRKLKALQDYVKIITEENNKHE
jgi:hypothetical protein